MAQDIGNSTKERFHALISGRVQGVSFRYYAREMARGLGVTGYVRNRNDGMVEVVAEGEADPLRQFLSWLRAGPRLARVEGVDVTWESFEDEFRAFEVRY
ncbi:MAG: acylphosphatase [Chloroflexota bacterium]|nr:acylphosphatase [Chloroflexota bacterium]